MNASLNAGFLLRAWQRYWFTPGSAEALAFARIVCCALAFLIYFTLDIRPWTTVSPAFWMPISFFRLLSGPPLNVGLIGLLQIVWKISLFTAALGLMTRASLFTATLLGFFVLGLPNCFGKIHHLDGIVVLLLLILAASRCDEALSVDRLFWKPRPAVPAPSGSFTWPIRIGQVLFLLIFAAAGVSKLLHSGFAWVEPDHMRALLLANSFVHQPPTRWASWVAASDAACGFAGIATVVVELSAIPAIFFASTRVPILIALFCLQTGISLLMGIYFTPYLVGYALFIPWRRLYRKLQPAHDV